MNAPPWTTHADVQTSVRRLWDRGVILASLVDAEPLFPKRLSLRTPTSTAISEQFQDVRAWIARLKDSATHYRIEWQTVHHRVVGTNMIPTAVWIDSLQDAVRLIGKHSETKRFETLLDETRRRCPELLSWLRRRPLRAVEIASDWSRMLDVAEWLRANPRPMIHLRQIALPGIHTKFIEEHRSVLSELFDCVLPANAINEQHAGRLGFARRYGFIDKPTYVRFRILDATLRVLPIPTNLDVTVAASDFAALNLPIRRVFVTENETNFLAFPPLSESMVIFGAGYGFDWVADAQWLQNTQVWYWGDIDTHGFAILHELRTYLPHAASMLMDEATLLDHRDHWSTDTHASMRTLSHLTEPELVLYQRLCSNHWGTRVRLEQERVSFSLLQRVLASYSATPG